MSDMTNSTGNGTFADAPFMNATDIELLTNVSRMINENVQSVIAEMTMFGVYFVLLCMALYTLSHHARQTPLSLSLLAALLTTASLTTYQAGYNIAVLCSQIESMLINHPEWPFVQRVQSFWDLPWLRPAEYAAVVLVGSADLGVLFLIINALVVWRATSLWSSKPAAKSVFPVSLYLLLLVNFVLWIAYSALANPHIPRAISNNTDLVMNGITIAGSVVSIVTNCVASGMVLYATCGDLSFSTRSGIKLGFSKVLILLTEAGVFHAMIQIVRLALACSVDTSNDTYRYSSLGSGSHIFMGMSTVIATMYPTAIILIIDYSYSVAALTHRQLNPSSSDSSSLPNGGTGYQPKIGRAARGHATHTISDIAFNGGGGTVSTGGGLGTRTGTGTGTRDLELGASTVEEDEEGSGSERGSGAEGEKEAKRGDPEKGGIVA